VSQPAITLTKTDERAYRGGTRSASSLAISRAGLELRKVSTLGIESLLFAVFAKK
jgi:hypothetical protein